MLIPLKHVFLGVCLPVCLPAGLSRTWQGLYLRLPWLCGGMEKNPKLDFFLL